MTRQADGDEVVKTTIYLPPYVHRNLKVLAARKNVSMSDIVLAALSELVHPVPGQGFEGPPGKRA